MIRLSNTITIARTPAVVFGYLADIESLPRWNYAIAATGKLDPWSGHGGRTVRADPHHPTRSEEAFEVIEFEPNPRLAIRGGFGPFSGDLSCALEAGGDRTVLTNAVALHAPRRLGLVEPLATRQIKSAIAAKLDVLRHALGRAVS